MNLLATVKIVSHTSFIVKETSLLYRLALYFYDVFFGGWHWNYDVCDLGEGGVKKPGKNSDVFYGRTPNKTGNKSISFQTKRKSHWSKEGYWTKNDGLYNAGDQTLVEVASQVFFSKHVFKRCFQTFQSSIERRIRKLWQKCKKNKNSNATSKRSRVILRPIHQNQMRNVSFSYKQTSLYVFDSQEYIHMEYKLYNNSAATLIRLVVEFFLRSTILYVCFHY